MNQLINIVEEIKINASRNKPIILNGSRLACIQAIDASLSYKKRVNVDCHSEMSLSMLYNEILRAAGLPHPPIDATMDILDIVEPLLEDDYELVTISNFQCLSENSQKSFAADLNVICAQDQLKFVITGYWVDSSPLIKYNTELLLHVFEIMV